MTKFETETLQAIAILLITKYGITLEPHYNDKGVLLPDHYKCNIHDGDFYFVCMLEPNLICMDSSNCEFMMAIYTPNEIESVEELLETLEAELTYYL